MSRRKGTYNRHSGVHGTAAAGYVGQSDPTPDRKPSFSVRSYTLLETMRNPARGDAVREAAEKGLATMILRRKSQLSGFRENLFNGRKGTAGLSSEELRELTIMNLKETRLAIIEARFKGEQPSSKRILELVQRANALSREIGAK